MINNPWISMSNNTRKRVYFETNLNIFWIKDTDGHYGIYFESVGKIDEIFNFSLKGIEITKREKEKTLNIYLFLKNNIDWEIFFILCKDICAASIKKLNKEEAIKEIYMRLDKWKNLLSSNAKYCFSQELEKGLYGELVALKDILIPKFGVRNAIENWTGPDFDKQDFIIENYLIEVKSFTSNKGRKITISSPEQLIFSDSQHLFLVTIELIKISSGQTLQNLIDEILTNEDFDTELKNKFELKILNYGYIKELCYSDLNKYLSINKTIYKVDEFFPRIHPSAIMQGVNNVKYKIDLWSCEKNKIDKII